MQYLALSVPTKNGGNFEKQGERLNYGMRYVRTQASRRLARPCSIAMNKLRGGMLNDHF